MLGLASATDEKSVQVSHRRVFTFMIRHFDRSGETYLYNLYCWLCFTLCSGLPRLPPKGFYFFLDEKVTKNQGLDLMSDKFVKAFRSPAQAPDEKSGRACCLWSVLV